MTTASQRTTRGDTDKTDLLLLLAGIGLATLATLPVLAVAGPAWFVWRLATRKLPAWSPLAALALLAGAVGLAYALAGQPPERAVLGFVDVQLEAGKTLVDGYADARLGRAPAPELATFSRSYAGRVWPYGLVGGLALALSWDAWRRLRAPRRRPLRARERHPEAPEAPRFPQRVTEMADAGTALVLTTDHRWGKRPVRDSIPPGYTPRGILGDSETGGEADDGTPELPELPDRHGAAAPSRDVAGGDQAGESPDPGSHPPSRHLNHPRT